MSDYRLGDGHTELMLLAHRDPTHCVGPEFHYFQKNVSRQLPQNLWNFAIENSVEIGSSIHKDDWGGVKIDSYL
jgi:hypothetical protein